MDPGCSRAMNPYMVTHCSPDPEVTMVPGGSPGHSDQHDPDGIMDLRHQHKLGWLTRLWASLQPSVVTEAININQYRPLLQLRHEYRHGSWQQFRLGCHPMWEEGNRKKSVTCPAFCSLYLTFNYVYVHVCISMGMCVSILAVIMCVCISVGVCGFTFAVIMCVHKHESTCVHISCNYVCVRKRGSVYVHISYNYVCA